MIEQTVERRFDNRFASQIRMEELSLFVNVARLKSFTAAAKQFEISQPTVSKRIRKLESNLSMQLLERSTRQVKLTEFGNQFLQHSQRLLAEFETILQFVHSSQQEPSGELNVTLPNWIFAVTGAQFYTHFTQKYPKILLSLNMPSADRLLGEQESDVIITTALPKHRHLKSYELQSMRINFFATRSYLAKHPKVTHPSELNRLHCLQFRHPLWPQKTWLWKDQQGKSHPLALEPAMWFENLEQGVELAMFDGGVIWCPEYLVERMDKHKQLVPVFEHDYAETLKVFAMHPHHKVLPKKIEVFLNEVQAFYT